MRKPSTVQIALKAIYVDLRLNQAELAAIHDSACDVDDAPKTGNGNVKPHKCATKKPEETTNGKATLKAG